MSTLKTNAILDASGGNTTTVNGIRPGLDPENRIINGAFDFWQRGTSFTTSGAYTSDRWISDFSGGTVTTTRQAFPLGTTLGSNNPTYFLRHAVSGQSLTSHYAILSHRVESVRSYAGQTITVLGWARANTTPRNMAFEALQYFGSGGSPSDVVLGIGVTTVALTTSWAPFAITINVPSISGKTLGSNNNDFLQFNFWISEGGLRSTRTNSLGIQAAEVDFWGIHIKQGTHTIAAADLYRQPELGPELARCQRYFCSSFTQGVTPANFVTAEAGAVILNLVPYSSTVSYAGSVSFPTPMRAAPAVTIYSFSPIATPNRFAYYDGAWQTATANGVTGLKTTGFSIEPAGSFTAYVPRLGAFAWAADAEL